MVDGELGQSAESPTKAILLQSPGRKPWVNRRNTFIEPCKGGTFPTRDRCTVSKRQVELVLLGALQNAVIARH